MNHPLSKIAEKLLNAKSVLMVSHIDPDGDSIGSLLTLGQMLKDNKVHCDLVMPDKVPHRYEFMPGNEFIKLPSDVNGEWDLGVSLDAANLTRLGDAAVLLSKCDTVINIDHHSSNTEFGDIHHIDHKACATCEIIYNLTPYIIDGLTIEQSTNLYIGIYSDTGSFRYGNTSENGMRICAELISHGIDAKNIAKRIYLSRPPQLLRLTGRALSTLELTSQGQIGYLTITREMFKAVGVLPGESGELITYAFGVEGVMIGILFRELSPDRVKASFRSIDGLNVNNLAAKFGGGHSSAAACTINANLDEARNEVLKAAKELLNAYNNRS